MSKRDSDSIRTPAPHESSINDESIPTTSLASSLADNPNDPIERSNMNSTVEQNDDRVSTTSTNMSTVYDLVEYMLKNSTEGLPRVRGDLYHLRLAIMIILRKYSTSQLENEFDFAVALEVTAAGKFDDIVLFYSSPRQVTGAWYIQAKYKQNMGSKIEEHGLCASWDSKSNDFSIPMYFRSFLGIDQNLPNTQARYILCTTAGLHKDMQQYFKVILNNNNNQQQDDSIRCDAVNTVPSDLMAFCKDIDATCYQLDWDKPFPALLEAVKDSCLSALGRKLALFVCSGEVITLNDTFFSTFLNLIYKCIESSELETSDPSGNSYKLTKGFSDETYNHDKTNKETKKQPIEKIQTAFKTERKKLLERKFKNQKTDELKIKFDKASFKSAQETQGQEEFAKFKEKLREFYSNFFLICNSCNQENLRETAIGLMPSLCVDRETVFDKLQGKLMDAMKAERRVPMDLAFWHKIFVNVNQKQNITGVVWYSNEYLKSVREKHPHIEVNPERLKEFKLYEVLKESGPGIYEFNSTLELTVYSRIIFQALSLLQYDTIFVDSAKYTKQQDMNDVLEDLLSYLRDVNHSTIKVITILGKPNYVSINKLKVLSDKNRQKIIIMKHISGSPQNDEISERIYVKDLSNEALQQLYLQNERMMFGTTTPLIGIVEENDDLSFLLNVLEPCEPNEELIYQHLNKNNYEKIKYWYVHRHYMPYEEDNKLNENDLEFHSALEVKRVLATSNEEPDLPGFQNGDSGKVFIFLNDAGFGKTTYFTWLAWRLASYDQSLYVIKFIALEFSTDFQRLSNVENLDKTEIVRLLYRYIHLALFVSSINKRTIKETDGFRDEADRCANLLTVSNGEIVLDETRTKTLSTIELIELRLFKEKFNEHKLVLILDGFDEIAPYFKDVVMKCFGRFSRLDGVRLLYLSSRPYGFEQELKNTFPQCQIYRLKPFSSSDIIKSLHKFLVNNLDGYERYKESHRNSILLMLFQIITHALSDIIKIPLLLYMVQIALLPKIKSCVNENTHNISQEMLNNNQIDILYLVEKFIDRKLEIANTDKIGTTDSAASTAAAIIKEVRLKKEIMKQHMLLAMYVIFDAKDREKLLSKVEKKRAKNIIKKVNQGAEKTGIVLGVQDGLPQFLHRIFAEYFSACWLFENWKRFKNESIFYSKVIWSNSFSKIREFFDRLILRESKGCDLHLALVNDSFNQVKEILSNNPSAVTVKDRVGRLPLHLVKYIRRWHLDPAFKTVEILSILREMSPELFHVKDELFGWNALDYAIFYEDWKIIEMFCESGVEPNMDILIQRVCSKDIYSLLWMAFKYTHFLNDLMDQKDLADELSERVAKYLIEEKKIDIYAPHAQLQSSSVLETVVTKGSIFMFRQLIEKSGPQKLGLGGRAKRLFLISLKKERHDITYYLIERNPSFVSMIKNNQCLYLCAKKAIESNQKKLFKTIFIQVCSYNRIKCVKKDIIIDRFDDRMENETINFEIPFEQYCCSKDFYYCEDEEEEEDAVVTNIFSAAIHYGNIPIVRYILQKTNVDVTVEMIGNVMAWIRNNYFGNHKNNVPVYRYILKKGFDPYGDDQEGLNLFLMTIKHGCVYMLPSLVAIGFNPKKICMRNHWDIFQYRLDMSTEMCSANVFVYLQQRSYLDCFDAFGPEDESIFEYAIKSRRFIVAQALIEDKFRNESEKEKAILELLHLHLLKYRIKIICGFIKSSLDESSIGGKMENDTWHSVYFSIFNRIPIV
uniref:NACHT domain-containing protein n=1 Tax=Anopheles funestus TaxID=62324 RepID=A0A4Y0BIT0_ANOFN